ncbi:PilN domain-containing protein [Acinetobacter nectaris]|uniref:PilN domain-containing protein n=1 Tax=Acinetobacter nectaris TaxID=1219382 RepID=UPI001F2EB8B0|nr:PilN domain-containing protein [Acinetobacter nectaris]MCF8999024.1 PilN domain-containing protein [Acinetobacter nectaris]MCF9027288.1 PilN domain-containing protein [Acinetobacter nectaris]
MSKINLLPWRDELRETRKKAFVFISVLAALIGIVITALAWFYFNQRLNDQTQANQIVTTSNQELDQKLKSLDGLQERRKEIVDRMHLIQNLQSQRPVVVRLLDELPRVIPKNVFLTKFTRNGNSFTFEGRAESPNAVAEMMRLMSASPWYRNVFMSSFLANDNKGTANMPSSVVPRDEDKYGTFIVTADLGEKANDLNALTNIEQRGE